MKAIRAWIMRLTGLFGKSRRDRELADELESHLQLHIEDNMRAGMTAEAARRDALIKLGGIEQTKESYRERRALPALETLMQDVRYGLRQLRCNPGFTLTAVLTLALGIGANSAIFSVVNGVLLRGLPYADSGRLVTVWESNARQGYSRQNASPADFMDWKTQNQVFTGMAAFINWGANLSGGDRPERVNATIVSANLFEVLGVAPMLGRSFLPSDEQVVPNQVVLLSYGLWQSHYAGDGDIVGKTVDISGRKLTVIGVMPPQCRFPADLETEEGYSSHPAELWLPLSRPSGEWKIRDFHYLRVIGRLKTSIITRQAEAQMSALQHSIMEQYGKQYGQSDSDSGIRLIPMHEASVGRVRRALLVLFGAVVFVLLIACANLANLQMARASVRSREFAIRAALGAGRRRLVKQLVTESLLLSTIGGSLGLLLGALGVRALLLFDPGNLPRLQEVHTDLSALAFTLLVSVLAGLIFGSATAFKVSNSDLNHSLKQGGRGPSEDAARRRLRSGFLIAELGLALVLLAGAGLMVRSFVSLQQVDPGFNPSNLLTLQLTLAGPRHPQDRQADFFRQVMERIGRLPGVTADGATTALPLTGENDRYDLEIEGRPGGLDGTALTADYSAVSPGYFQALGIPLVRGRAFSEQDTTGTAAEVVINQTFARRYFPSEDPIGRRIHVGNDRHPGYSQIVGVVGDTRHNGLDAEVSPTMYESYIQSPGQSMDIVVRTTSDPLNIVTPVRAEVAGLDSDQPVSKVMTMEQVLGGAVAQPRFRMLLLSLFAALALVLAAVGVYGVVSYTAAQRTHEIGIRVALGATRGQMFKLLMGESMAQAIIGLSLGLAAALALTRLFASLLYGVRPSDPVTFAAMSGLLMAVALLASYVPARRALRVDPVTALRYQ